MLVSMTCKCGADFQVDTRNNELLASMWAQQFITAHGACGFMAPVIKDKVEEPGVIIINTKKEVDRDL